MAYYMASVSWGKDSLAMLLRLIYENKPLNEVVFFDTGMEFQAIYDVRNAVLGMLKVRQPFARILAKAASPAICARPPNERLL